MNREVGLRDIQWGALAAGWLLAALIGVLGAWALSAAGWWHDGAAWEIEVLYLAQATVSKWLDPVFLWLPYFGTNYTLLPIVTIVSVFLWLRGFRIDALHLATIQLGSLLLNVTLKNLLQRPRPDLFEMRGQYAMSAYPSGHSIAVTSVVLTAAYLLRRHGFGRWVYFVAAVIFLANNYSRVYLGVHWATDVFGGVAIGAVWLGAGVFVFGRAERLNGGRGRKLNSGRGRGRGPLGARARGEAGGGRGGG